MILQQKE